MLFIKSTPINTCPILCDRLPTIETPIIDNFVFFTNDIIMILRIAPDNEKKKLKPNPVLIRATINTLTSDIIRAVLKLYLYKAKIITILARPNLSPGMISPIKVK